MGACPDAPGSRRADAGETAGLGPDRGRAGDRAVGTPGDARGPVPGDPEKAGEAGAVLGFRYTATTRNTTLPLSVSSVATVFSRARCSAPGLITRVRPTFSSARMC